MDDAELEKNKAELAKKAKSALHSIAEAISRRISGPASSARRAAEPRTWKVGTCIPAAFFAAIPPSRPPPRSHVLASPRDRCAISDCSYCFFLDKERSIRGAAPQ